MRRVFLAVGLIGDGDIGVRGTGDLRARLLVVTVDRDKDSLGFAARASMVKVLETGSEKATLRCRELLRVRRRDDLSEERAALGHGRETRRLKTTLKYVFGRMTDWTSQSTDIKRWRKFQTGE